MSEKHERVFFDNYNLMTEERNAQRAVKPAAIVIIIY